MSGILHIDKGASPQWWLSPDIWDTHVGDPTTFPGVGNPIAGETYNVSVVVHDNYKQRMEPIRLLDDSDGRSDPDSPGRADTEQRSNPRHRSPTEFRSIGNGVEMDAEFRQRRT